MTVKDNVVAVSKDTFDLVAGIPEPASDLPQAFHAVFDQRIVLAIGGDSVKPEGIFDPAFEQGLFVEGDGDVFVGLGHGLSPWSELRVGGLAAVSGNGWIASPMLHDCGSPAGRCRRLRRMAPCRRQN